MLNAGIGDIMLTNSKSSTETRIGELVTIVPNSCDGVLASVDTLYGVRGDRIEHAWGLWERAS